MSTVSVDASARVNSSGDEATGGASEALFLPGCLEFFPLGVKV